MSVIYKPRGTFVLFRLTKAPKVRGMVMPDRSEEGNKRVVEAIGPDVENLNVGDKVLVIGEVGSDVIAIPGENGLYLTREANVVLVVEKGPDREGEE